MHGFLSDNNSYLYLLGTVPREEKDLEYPFLKPVPDALLSARAGSRQT